MLGSPAVFKKEAFWVGSISGPHSATPIEFKSSERKQKPNRSLGMGMVILFEDIRMRGMLLAWNCLDASLFLRPQ